MSIQHAESVKHFEELINTTDRDFVFVDFYAQWCGPCKRIAPKLEKMTSEFPNVLFLKVDVDEAEDLAAKYEIRAMPTFIVFKKGSTETEAGPIKGADEDKIRNLLKTVTNGVVVADEF